MESTFNDDTEANILDYALMLLKSTENLKKTLETLTEEMQKNKPDVTPSEVKLKEAKIKKASSMMKIMQKLRRKKKTQSGKSSGSSVSIIKGQKKSTSGSSLKMKKKTSKEPFVESVIKKDIFGEMTPKPSVIQKSELQLARKTISRPQASLKRSNDFVSITSEATVKLIPNDVEHVTFLDGTLTVICCGEAIRWIKPDGNVLDQEDKDQRVHVEAKNDQLILNLFNINGMDIGIWTCLSAIDNTKVAFNLKKFCN
ncbi:unnamed protein product [Diamesa tonsa]